MKKPVILAAAAAALLIAASWLLVRPTLDPRAGASPGGGEGARAGSVDGSTHSSGASEPGGTSAASLLASTGSGDPSLSAGSTVPTDAPSSGQASARNTRGGRGAAEGPAADAKDPGRAGEEDDWDGDLLAGGHLSAALRQALQDKDLGALQALLIAGLTLKGTKLGADDVPSLFEALLTVDDYGLQKLLLTHLQRIEAPPADIAAGYADYLLGATRPTHYDEVFGELVRLGADASYDALSGLFRDASDDRLRSRAAQALGDLQDPRAVPLLRQALYGAEDGRAAKPYVDALARLGGAEAVSSLVDYVSQRGNEASMSALRGITDPAAAPILADALNGRSSEEYQRAAMAKLRSMPDPQALDDLSRFLGSARGPIVRDAIETIGRIRDARAVRVLEDFATREQDPKVAAQALRAATRVRTQLAGNTGR